MKSRVLSLRLKPDQMERLQRLARRADRKPSELAARLLEEALRMSEFSHIEFRDTIIGRQAFIKGHRLTVWMLVWIARGYDFDPERTAEHLQWPRWLVEAGLAYYRGFQSEIDPAVEEHESSDLETLRQALPGIKVFTVNLRDEATVPATTATPPVEANQDASAAAR